MKNYSKYFFFNSLIFISQILIAQNEIKLSENNINSVIKKLSLEEKAALIVGTGLKFGEPYDSDENFKIPNKPITGSLAANSKIYTIGAIGRTLEIQRLGITSMEMIDGPAGVSFGKRATAFPIANGIASTWDKNLAYQVGECIGKETLEYGLDLILAPAINIHRNPLTGRNFEYYSEDPLISGKIGASLINGIQSNGVGTSLKHFAANNQETNRIEIDAIISERALREIYLRGFEYAIKESNPWTLMASYNSINGNLATQNYDLITKIAREDWGYEGIIMSDWEAGNDPVEQIKAGLNLIMPGPYQNTRLIEAVKNKEIEETLLDKNIEWILRGIVRTPKFKKEKYHESINFDYHRNIAKKAASEGMVLLKNNNCLPILKANAKIALFGNGSYDTIIGGSGSGFVMNSGKTVSIEEGIINNNFSVNINLADIYKNYILNNTPSTNRVDLVRGRKNRASEMKIDRSLISKMARENDIAILTISRISGERNDRVIEGDFELTEIEMNNIKNIADEFHIQGKKIIVLLNIGGVIETYSWKNIPDAILLTWLPGEVAGNAIAEVINGQINPSGKLTSTFPIKYEDEPSALNFPGIPKEHPRKVLYKEGIYVGYRYFNSFGVKASYPFGFGLSYTEFEYSEIKLDNKIFNKNLTISLKIKNIGKMAGKEVVQLYLKAPNNTIDKPLMELKGFEKTTLLQPGETETLQFILNPKDLTSYHESLSSWVADPGLYEILIGSSSMDIKLKSNFRLRKRQIIEKTNKALSPKEPINELKLSIKK